MLGGKREFMEPQWIEECKKVKAIFLDMDGTLCDGNSQVPEEFPQVLEGLRAKGLQVGIASGRSNLLLRQSFKEETDRLLMICSNGAVLQDKGEVFFQSEIPEEAAKAVLRVLQEYDQVMIYLLCPDGVYTNVHDGKVLEGLERAGLGMEYVPDLEAKTGHINDIGVNGRLPESLDGRIDFEKLGLIHVTSGHVNQDILVKGISKKVGIYQFCQRLGITPDQVMALGDEENDLEMMEAVGFPVAMKNAIPSVLKKARYITKEDHVHHGALHFLTEAFELQGIYESERD